MKIFNIAKDFNQINVSSPRHVNKLLEELSKCIDDDKCVELNLEGCLTDYPNTPKLISFLLERLSAMDGNKELNIKLDGLGNKEIYILYDTVLEGDFFGIHEKITPEQELNQWHDRMNSILSSKNMILRINYSPEDKTYQYGNIND